MMICSANSEDGKVAKNEILGNYLLSKDLPKEKLYFQIKNQIRKSGFLERPQQKL